MSRKLNSDSYLKKSKEMPGPGQYNNVGLQLARPGVKFNRQKKIFEYPLKMREGRDSPGPATHSEVPAHFGKSFNTVIEILRAFDLYLYYNMLLSLG